MACDIRIASDRAQFGTFEVRRGMHPADGGIPRLVNVAGVGIALEMLLTVLEIVGRPLHDQLRVEAMWGYALCASNPAVQGRSQEFFDKTDRGRAGSTATPL